MIILHRCVAIRVFPILVFWLFLWAMWLILGCTTGDGLRKTHVPDQLRFVRGGLRHSGMAWASDNEPGPKSTQTPITRWRPIAFVFASPDLDVAGDTNPVDIELDCDAATTTRIRENINWCRQQPATQRGTIPQLSIGNLLAPTLPGAAGFRVQLRAAMKPSDSYHGISRGGRWFRSVAPYLG